MANWCQHRSRARPAQRSLQIAGLAKIRSEARIAMAASLMRETQMRPDGFAAQLIKALARDEEPFVAAPRMPGSLWFENMRLAARQWSTASLRNIVSSD